MLSCWNCDQDYPDGAVYCDRCGLKLMPKMYIPPAAAAAKAAPENGSGHKNVRKRAALQIVFGLVCAVPGAVMLFLSANAPDAGKEQAYKSGAGPPFVCAVLLVALGIMGVIYGERKAEILQRAFQGIFYWTSGRRLLIFTPVFVIIVFLVFRVIAWIMIAIHGG